MPPFPTTNGVVTFSSPPEGYVVDFENPQKNLHVEHYWLFAVGGLLATLSLGQRLYTRIYLAKGLHIDDGMNTPDAICSPYLVMMSLNGLRTNN